MHPATAFLTLGLTLLAGSAVYAEDKQLSLSEFLDLMDGRTANFSHGGKPYGSEAYHPNKRVIWRDTDGTCIEGTWRSIADFLCFRYGTISCWKVFQTDKGGYYAVSDDGFQVEFEEITDGAFDCQGAPLS